MKSARPSRHALSLAVAGALFTSAGAMAANPVVADGQHVDISNSLIEGAPTYMGHAITAINGGNVTGSHASASTTGDEAHGAISSGAGSVVDLTSSTLRTQGYVSHGLLAIDGGQIKAESVDIVTTGANGRGLYSEGSDSVLSFSGGSIITTNTSADGLIARNGGTVNVGRDAAGKGTTIDVRGSALGAIIGSLSDLGSTGTGNFDGTTILSAKGPGVYVGGAGATATLKESVIQSRGVGMEVLKSGRADLIDTTIETSGPSAHGINVSSGGAVNAVNVNVTAHGDEAAALLANGANSTIAHSGGILRSEGNMPNTASPERLATVTTQDGGSIALENVSIENLHTSTVSGPEGAFDNVRQGMGVLADGGNISVSNSTIQAKNGATVVDSGHLELNNAFVEALGGWGVLAGDNATAEMRGGAILVRQSAGTVHTPNANGRAVSADTGGRISLNGTAVEVQQLGGVGLTAYGPGSSINMTGGSVLMTANEAKGVVAGYGYWSPSLVEGTVNLSETSVETKGDHSVGLLAHYNGSINADKTQVLASGADSTAAHIAGATLLLTDSVLASTGANSSGLSVGNDGLVTAKGSMIASDHGQAIVVDGDSTINLTDSQAWSGDGVLLGNSVASDAAVSGTINFNAKNSELYGDINLSENYVGNFTLSEGTMLHGAAHAVDEMSLVESLWDMTADSLVGNLSSTNSTIAFNHDDGAFKTLTVTGNYVGDNALLKMNTVLGDDTSATDKLHVLGDTSGQSGIMVNNIGGQGAQTNDGIQLVQVDGASNGQFDLVGRAVGGSYEYFLHKGGKADPNDGDWYLRSELPVDPPPADPCLADPNAEGCGAVVDPPVDPCLADPNAEGCGVVVVPPVDPDPCFDVGACIDPVGPEPTKIYRPEIGAYLANQAAAVGMFNQTMHERLGEPNLAERLKSDDMLGSAWVRTTSDHSKFNVGEGQLDVTSHSSLLQVGTDLAKWGQDSRGLVGVMLGAGKANNQSRSNLTGYGAKGTVNGQALGVYASWFQSPSDQTGLYLDGWVQASRFQNKVQGDALAIEKYDSKALTGSVEAGYAFKLHEGANSALFIEPQAQVTYSDYSMDNDKHVETNGTEVTTIDAGGLLTRMGVRMYGHGTSDQGNRVQPFVGVNWIRSERNGNSLAFNETYIDGGQPRDVYEAKAGAQLQMGGGWTGWGELNATRGKNDYQAYGAQLGVKYSW